MKRDVDKAQRFGRLTIREVALACASVLASSAATAQSTAADAEEVVVTGTRIRDTGFSTPTPVTAVTAEQLELMAPGNLIEAVTQLPIFFNNTTQDAPGAFFNSPGAGSLNIRGLNTNRTLTLLNGRRMPPSNRVGAVDINVFPEEIVERIEVVTGGASAAYGSDAVAGVANFILDTDFEGFEAHAQSGTSSANSRGTWEAGAVFGTAIGERGHLLASAEAYGQDHVFDFTKQDWYESWGQVRTAPGFDTVAPHVVASVGSQYGVLSATGIAPITFDENGNPVPFVLGQPNGGGAHSIANGGSGTPNGQEFATLSPEAERKSGFFYYDFDLGERTNLYAQMVYGENYSKSNNAGGTFTVGNTLRVFRGNAFLPSTVQQIFDSNPSLQSMSFTRIGGLADLAPGAAQATTGTSQALTFGFEHDVSADGLLDGWQVRGYLQSGKTDQRGDHIRGVRIDRVPAAIDAVRDPNGNIVCYAALRDPANWSDCVPLNLFGPGKASPAAVEWVTGLDAGIHVTTPVYFTDSGFSRGRTLDYLSSDIKVTDTEVEQDVIDLSIDGEIAEGWAGPISAAFGLHYREESILQLTFDHTNPSGGPDARPAMFDPTIVRGNPVGMSERTTAIQFASVPNLEGGFDVTEAFAEFMIPLVADKPAVDSLSATVAARWIDYSATGSIQAWKGGLDWQVGDAWRVRTTISRDIRAATLAERFDRTGGTTNVLDPMFGVIVPTGTYSGGNPNLKPEEADTRTVGTVFQPRSVPGFQMSLDWYEINLTGAVGQLGSQVIVDECWNYPTSSACSLLNRDTNGVITFIENIFVNINAAKASGIDLETAFRANVGTGSLLWRFVATQLNENSITNLGAPKVDRAGDVGTLQLPEFKVTTSLNYSQGPFSAFLQARFIDGGMLDSRDIEGVTISDNTVDSVLYTDARVSYSKDANNGNSWEVFGAVTNVFDQDPPVVANFSASTLQATQTNAALHDVLGRRYTVGFRYRL
jgi:outer membrane receptor protein involved in Fe transport